jgi:hypothetical protein
MLLLLHFSSIYGQFQVLDAEKKVGIPFASVGVTKRTTGVICDENGNFSFGTITLTDNDSLLISAIGYYSQQVSYKKLKSDNKPILLKAQAFQLNEVSVKAKKIVYKTLGTTNYSKNNCSGFVKNQLNWKGSESSIFIANSRRVRIEDFKFHIIQNRYSDSLTFRLMFYKSNVDMPGETFLKKPIVFKVKQSKGEFKLNLKDYFLYAEGDFFVSLECLMDEMNIVQFCYAGSYKTPSYVRDSPFSKWTRVRGGGSDFNLKISYTN